MRPVPGRGRVPGKPGSFKTPFRRRVKLRYIRDALRGRASLMPLRCPLAHRRGIAIPGPFGSANRAASSKPARFFRRWRRFAAFLFPAKPASLGFCGGPYRLRRKEKALFDGVKRKDAGGGIPGFARNARSACYGGFVLAMVVGSDLSTASDHRKSWGHFRMLSASLFAAAVRRLRKTGNVGGTLPRMPGCGSEKRTAVHPGGTRDSVDVKS